MSALALLGLVTAAPAAVAARHTADNLFLRNRACSMSIAKPYTHLIPARSTVTVSGVVRSAVIGEGLLYYRGKRYCLSDLNEEMNISKKYA